MLLADAVAIPTTDRQRVASFVKAATADTPPGKSVMDWRAHRADFFGPRTYYSVDNDGGFGADSTMFCWDGSTYAWCSEYPYNYNSISGEAPQFLTVTDSVRPSCIAWWRCT